LALYKQNTFTISESMQIELVAVDLGLAVVAVTVRKEDMQMTAQLCYSGGEGLLQMQIVDVAEDLLRRALFWFKRALKDDDDTGAQMALCELQLARVLMLRGRAGCVGVIERTRR
jgi:hypothetical protein